MVKKSGFRRAETRTQLCSSSEARTCESGPIDVSATYEPTALAPVTPFRIAGSVGAVLPAESPRREATAATPLPASAQVETT